MKTTLLFLSAATMLFMASCSHGPSEATKAKVAAFDSAWTAMGTMAMTANDSITKCMADCDNCNKMMTDSSAKCCEHMKSKMDEAMKACHADMETFSGMQKMMTDSKPMWDSAMTAFTAFKEQIASGKINDEEANKTLEGFQVMMNQGAAQMAEMQTKCNEAMATCKQNCSKGKECCAKTQCDDKKCMDMHKKKEKV